MYSKFLLVVFSFLLMPGLQANPFGRKLIRIFSERISLHGEWRDQLNVGFFLIRAGYC